MASTACFTAVPRMPWMSAVQFGSPARVPEGVGSRSPYPALRQNAGAMCAQSNGHAPQGMRGDHLVRPRRHEAHEGTPAAGDARRRSREDLTPRLCKNLRAGGCYEKSCCAHHGRRYFDAALGLWRTKRMFRQSTARPVHELSSANPGLGPAESLGDVALQNGTFVLKCYGAEHENFSTGDRLDKSSKSRAVRNHGQWRNMCERCQRPDKVCICSSLPRDPIPIESRLIILQHPKERKKATYGTVPIVCLCIDNVHVITANLNGPIAMDLPPPSEVDAGKRHMEKKHQHEMKRSAALCAAFENDAILQEALGREGTLLLFPDLDPHDPFLLERPELVHKKAVNLEQHFAEDGARMLSGEDRGRTGEGTEGDVKAREQGRTLIAIDGTWAQVVSPAPCCCLRAAAQSREITPR